MSTRFFLNNICKNFFCQSEGSGKSSHHCRTGGVFLVSQMIVAVVILCFLSTPSFSQLALGRSKFVGNAITYGFQMPDNFLTYWNQVTPGNDGKWGSVENSQGAFGWSGLDVIYSFALTNGIPFKYHNLIWGSQQPGWISSLDSASQRAAVEAWIDSVGSRYRNMDFIDVVNEPFNSPPDGQNGRANYIRALGGTGATGWDWIVTAFTWARQYCAPGVKLLINEYNILQDNSRTSNYIALIDTLKVRGLIDGIGIQGHYFEFKDAAYLGSRYSYPVSTLKNNLDRIASATGLPIYISEFDIDEKDPIVQLHNFQIYFPLFWTDPAVKGMTLWGYNFGDTWKPYAYLDSLGVERPALKWLRTYLAQYLLQPVVISPIDTVGESTTPTMIWHSSEAASSYRLQVATDDIFSAVVVDSTVGDTLLQLPSLNENTKYYWRVAAMNASDTGDYSSSVSFVVGDTIDAVRKLEGIPAQFALSQNYPNPFNPSTVISYQLPSVSHVTLKVYDVLGREVAMLVDQKQGAGYYNVTFNAGNLPSGVYFYRLSADSKLITRKLVLVK